MCIFRNFLAVALCLSSLCAWALETDRKAPINIEADKVQLLQKQQMALYQGNVTFKQGSIKIQGDAIKVFSKNKKVSRVEVLGGNGISAAYSQTLDDGKTVSANGSNITLNLLSGDMVLTGNASLNDGQNVIKSDRIVYNQNQARIKANKTQSGGRVKMILQPPDATKAP